MISFSLWYSKTRLMSYELWVTIYYLLIENLKERVESWNSKIRIQILELRFQIQAWWAQLHDLQI